MNEQTTDSAHPIDLPTPQVEHPLMNSEVQGVKGTNEADQAIGVEIGVTSAAPPAFNMPMPQLPGAQAQPLTPVDHTLQPPAPGLPTIADDIDLIEKEWVNKAKEIVEQTKDDPFTQNKEISKVKADYLKKRYNKDIKLDA